MALSIFEFDKEREFKIVREDERKLGHAEGFNEGERMARITDIMELLSEHGTVPENIRTQISSENSIDKLKSWIKLAARTDNIESFGSRM